MDLCITAQEPFAYSLPTSKPFTPVPQASSARATPKSPLHHHDEHASSSTQPKQQQTLTFDLIIHDPSNNDSALTYPWDLPLQPLSIDLDTTKVQLLQILRDHLPCRNRASSNGSSSSSSSSSGSGSGSSGISNSRKPKLRQVTLYWTFRGSILPLGLSDDEWHYRNPITKTEMLPRSEMEWYLLKEMMASSDGALKCYFAILGEAQAPVKKTSYTKWFRSGR